MKRSGEGILLTQEKYTNDLLSQAKMSNCKPMNTPMSSTEKLSAFAGDQLGPLDATQYRSVVGALQYLTLTRPNISFAVNRSTSICAHPNYSSLECCETNSEIFEVYFQCGTQHT